jgi:hypothetical protein
MPLARVECSFDWGLKIPREQSLDGSSPSSGTKRERYGFGSRVPHLLSA